MKKARKIKIKTILICLISGVILLAAIVLTINSYMIAIGKKRILTPEEARELDADCILILGAGVWQDGRPSHMLEDRLLTGIDLYQKGASGRIIMSGDHGRKEYDEVNVMKNYAIDRDVNSSHIFMDHAGFSTYESLYRAKEVFQADRVIIVTQEYHLYRALYVARTLGLDAYGVRADLREYIGQSYRDTREIAARMKDFIYGIVKPKPTYLGESIPVFGDGDTTND